MMNPEGHLAKRKFDDEIVMLQQVASPNSSRKDFYTLGRNSFFVYSFFKL